MRIVAVAKLRWERHRHGAAALAAVINDVLDEQLDGST